MPPHATTAGLELPDGYIPKKKGNNKKRNGPSKPSVAVPPVTAQANITVAVAGVPKPWEVDETYGVRKPVPGKLSFNYERDWISYGVKPEQIGAELARDLACQRRRDLPPILKGESDEQLREIRKVYKEVGELAFFDSRLTNMNKAGFTRLIVASPFAAVNQPRENFLNEDNGLVKFLRIPELANQVIRHLMPSVRSVSALAATCRDAAINISANMEVWNSTTGDFLLDHFKDHVDQDGKVHENKGVRDNVLCIAASKLEHLHTVSPYLDGWKIMEKFIHGVIDTKNSFRDVIIDQLPFFDVRMFEMMIQTMTNLQSVAISRCLLLDVTKLRPLIEAIKRHPWISPDGTKTYIRADFAPYFFDGPNDAKRLGSYGVTYHEPTFHIAKAVTGLLIECVPKAREIGMDLTSDGSSFWHFVRRLPGPDALWSVKVRDVNRTCVYKRESIPKHLSTHARAQRLREIENAWADDLTAALAGDGIAPEPIPERVERRNGNEYGTYGYWRKNNQCLVCKNHFLGSLFSMQMRVCWPCEMVQFVDSMEDSHFRYRLKGVLDFLLDGVSLQASTFKTIVDGRKKKLDIALAAVVDTDRAWAHHLLNETGNLPFKAPYPELPVIGSGSEEGSSIRRLRLCRGHMEPVDFRMGGPQFMHPCRTKLRDRNLVDLKKPTDSIVPVGSEDYERFIEKWQWTSHTDDLVRQAVQGNNWGLTDADVDRYLVEAPRKKAQREFAIRLEWCKQCIFDRKVEVWNHGRIEDAVFSGIGHGMRSYNRDKLKEGCEVINDDKVYGYAQNAY